MNPFKKFSSWIKSLFGKKSEEVPVSPQEPSMSLTEALHILENFAGKLDEETSQASTSKRRAEDYHSGDRLDNKPKALRLAAGDPVGCLQRIIKPSEDIKDEWAALRKNYSTRFFEQLAYSADPNELAKLVAEADEAKLVRAQKAAALMATLGLILKDEEVINNQVKEIMEWSEEAFHAMERNLDWQYKCSFDSPAKKSGTKKKPTSRKPKKNKAKDVRLAPKRKSKRTKGQRK